MAAQSAVKLMKTLESLLEPLKVRQVQALRWEIDARQLLVNIRKEWHSLRSVIAAIADQAQNEQQPTTAQMLMLMTGTVRLNSALLQAKHRHWFDEDEIERLEEILDDTLHGGSLHGATPNDLRTDCNFQASPGKLPEKSGQDSA